MKYEVSTLHFRLDQTKNIHNINNNQTNKLLKVILD